MTDSLAGKTILIGAAIAPQLVTFERSPNEEGLPTPTVYTDSDIQLRIYSQDKKGKPDDNTPDLTLSVGSGLTRQTNTAAEVSVTMQITSSQLSNLLGTAEAARFGYVWAIRPVGAAEYFRAFLTDGYDGYFVVAREGYGGSESVKVP